MSDSAYAFSLTTFSPSGKLIQIDYAMAAVNQGGTALGIKMEKGGACIATEKKTQPLQDTSSVKKLVKLDEHVGAVYAGMLGDAKLIFSKAMHFCQVYRREYDMPIPIGQLVRKVADVMQEYTQSTGVRPFGCSLLIAGGDSNGDHLYQVDPSGLFICWKATAIGKNADNAKADLEKRYVPEMEGDDGINTAIRTLKAGFDGRMTEETIEIGKVVRDRAGNACFKVLEVDEIKDCLEELE